MSVLEAAKKMFSDWKTGTGYKHGDVLRRRDGVSYMPHGMAGKTVVVVKQCASAPHRYEVVAERVAAATPGERFIRFEVDGHEWERVGNVD